MALAYWCSVELTDPSCPNSFKDPQELVAISAARSSRCDSGRSHGGRQVKMQCTKWPYCSVEANCWWPVCSSAVPKAVQFGIKEENIFGFWDWVWNLVLLSRRDMILTKRYVNGQGWRPVFSLLCRWGAAFGSAIWNGHCQAIPGWWGEWIRVVWAQLIPASRLSRCSQHG